MKTVFYFRGMSIFFSECESGREDSNFGGRREGVARRVESREKQIPTMQQRLARSSTLLLKLGTRLHAMRQKSQRNTKPGYFT